MNRTIKEKPIIWMLWRIVPPPWPLLKIWFKTVFMEAKSFFLHFYISWKGPVNAWGKTQNKYIFNGPLELSGHIFFGLFFGFQKSDYPPLPLKKILFLGFPKPLEMLRIYDIFLSAAAVKGWCTLRKVSCFAFCLLPQGRTILPPPHPENVYARPRFDSCKVYQDQGLSLKLFSSLSLSRNQYKL